MWRKPLGFAMGSGRGLEASNLDLEEFRWDCYGSADERGKLLGVNFPLFTNLSRKSASLPEHVSNNVSAAMLAK